MVPALKSEISVLYCFIDQLKNINNIYLLIASLNWFRFTLPETFTSNVLTYLGMAGVEHLAGDDAAVFDGPGLAVGVGRAGVLSQRGVGAAG